MKQQIRYLDDICLALEQNDPTVTSVDLLRMPEVTDSVALRLSQALLGNSVVTELSLKTGSMTLVGVRGFLPFISHCNSLRRLDIFRGSYPEETITGKELETSVSKVDQLLLAAGLSETIECLQIGCECGVLAFASCLKNLRLSLKTLYLSDCFPDEILLNDIASHQLDWASDAVCRLPLLETLDLERWTGSRFPAFMTRRMANHPRLKCLRVNCLSMDAVICICELLESSTPLEELVVLCSSDEEPLATLLTCLHQHESLRELSFRSANPENEEEGVHLANLLRTNHRIEKLELSETGIHSAISILGALVGDNANRSLKTLYLSRAIEEISDEDEQMDLFWSSLINDIQRLEHLKDLMIEYFSAPPDELIPNLVQAFEKNTSLVDVCIDSLPWSWDVVINYYCKRNKYGPLLTPTAASKAKMLTIFLDLLDESDDDDDDDDAAVLSVIYDALRYRNCWKEDIINNK